jgi:hypothetical protein
MAQFGLRKYQRLERLVPVRYYGDGIVGEGIIQDLSLTGSYMTGNAWVSVGTTLALELFVPGNSEALLIDRVTVTWIKGSEFGVNFDVLQPKVAEQMTILIATLVKIQLSSYVADHIGST